jgi:hypothetical protein
MPATDPHLVELLDAYSAAVIGAEVRSVDDLQRLLSHSDGVNHVDLVRRPRLDLHNRACDTKIVCT